MNCILLPVFSIVKYQILFYTKKTKIIKFDKNIILKRNTAMTETYAVPAIYQAIQERQKNTPMETPIQIAVCGSKSITNRALLLATLAAGRSTLRGALFSDDSEHFLHCVQDLGFQTDVDETAKVVTVTGCGGAVPKGEAHLYVGSAGTAARFLTAYLGISQGVYSMDASAQMRKRPMAPLLDSLKELGCEILYKEETSQEGHFPFIIKSHGFQKDRITVNIDSSSQFLSALLISSCLSKEDFTIYVEGTHGQSYIDMTVKMMKQFGVTTTPLYYCGGNSESHSCSGCVNSTVPMGYRTAAGQSYKAAEYQIEPDVSAACYFYAMSPLLGIPVQVEHVHFDSLQGDVAFLRILEKMGCRALEEKEGIVLTPPKNGVFHGVTADMSACSDQAITLAAIAPFADAPTTITGIGHIRFQESDRIRAIATELGKMGIRCEEKEDAVTIFPSQPKASLVETYDDHRMAMGFSLTGLRAEGIVIDNPLCCKKTFVEYFDVLDRTVQKLLSR